MGVGGGQSAGRWVVVNGGAGSLAAAGTTAGTAAGTAGGAAAAMPTPAARESIADGQPAGKRIACGELAKCKTSEHQYGSALRVARLAVTQLSVVV